MDLKVNICIARGSNLARVIDLMVVFKFQTTLLESLAAFTDSVVPCRHRQRDPASQRGTAGILMMKWIKKWTVEGSYHHSTLLAVFTTNIFVS